ncbi:MAG: hypothetical protein ABR610_01790 [Thermoanaerobaculia bacterium]
MNECVRPLDPLDAEALAAGEEGILAADARSHASACARCAGAVEEARALLARLEALSGSGKTSHQDGAADLASRVVRIRPFSARERRSLGLWAPPAGGGLLVFMAGFALLAAPGLPAGDQAALGFSALAPLAGLARAAFRSFADALSTAPAAWEALSSAARLEAPLGALALLILAPTAFAFRRVLARATRRG